MFHHCVDSLRPIRINVRVTSFECVQVLYQHKRNFCVLLDSQNRVEIYLILPLFTARRRIHAGSPSVIFRSLMTI